MAAEGSMTPEANAQSILRHLLEGYLSGGAPTDRRFVIAIAGPPAAGKSTLASALVEQLGERAGLIGMDAFHFDNVILDQRGDRERKGAPHTFDVAGYAHTLRALRSNPTIEMAVPVFDRDLDASRSAASFIGCDQPILVTEGNYLLADEEPWSALNDLFDYTVWIDVGLDVVEQRIRDRWQTAGLDSVEVEFRAEQNDLPNARWVLEHSRPADLLVKNDA